MRKVSNSIPANESPQIGSQIIICKEIRNQQDECGIGDNHKKLPSGSHPVCEQDSKYLAVF
jgi:hypothetical protein